MNRFFDIPGDVSRQLSPWWLREIFKPIDEAWFELVEPLRFRSDIAGGVITIPTGYRSNLASIPRSFWSLMAPDDPRIALGAWVHDFLYEHRGFAASDADGGWTRLTRKQCDAILAYEAMPDCCAPRWRCHVVYAALRWFGDGWQGDGLKERRL